MTIDPAEAAAVARHAGLCGELSLLGFVCTRGRNHPFDEHRAMAVGGPEDGRVYERWPTTPAP